MKSILQTKILMIVTAICVVGYIAFGYFSRKRDWIILRRQTG